MATQRTMYTSCSQAGHWTGKVSGQDAEFWYISCTQNSAGANDTGSAAAASKAQQAAQHRRAPHLCIPLWYKQVGGIRLQATGRLGLEGLFGGWPQMSELQTQRAQVPRGCVAILTGAAGTAASTPSSSASPSCCCCLAAAGLPMPSVPSGPARKLAVTQSTSSGVSSSSCSRLPTPPMEASRVELRHSLKRAQGAQGPVGRLR